MDAIEREVRERLGRAAQERGLDVAGGGLRRTSSRFCLGVEHGDYNGTQLFGVGTDRFIWLAWKPNDRGRIRLHSLNFADQGVVDFAPGDTPPPRRPEDAGLWARFPWGVDYVLRRAGLAADKGFDAVLYGNIPGGGMSRSASLTLNLIRTFWAVGGIEPADPFAIIDHAQAVENSYIGSPCGQLDQIMIHFARAGMGTFYDPARRTVDHVPLGPGGERLRLVGLDTGTVRPGLETSTYRIRRAECEELVALAREAGFDIRCLADVKDPALHRALDDRFRPERPELLDRLAYIHGAQERFDSLLEAWRAGDLARVGALFRRDGIGLRDEYRISGPELESMCDIARTVPGVLGERMLGGGDKGAAGALVEAGAEGRLREAVDRAYPLAHPEYASRYAVHVCAMVDGVTDLAGL